MTQKSCAVGLRNAILRNHFKGLSMNINGQEKIAAITQRIRRDIKKKNFMESHHMD